MHTVRICRRCNAPIPAETPDSACPECGCHVGADPFADPVEEPQSAPTPAELAPFFPGLEIIEVAGYGGMGTIYKARQPQLDRVVALKILSLELGKDPAFAQRFSSEAQALAKLNHSNIVSIFDFGRAGGHYYFLMEYVDGMTLRMLMQQKAIQTEEAQRIVIEICHALQYAHEEGIVHQDIKPSNILLDKKGRVKIADFGLAHLAGQNAKDAGGRSQPAMVLGTPPYMAPEQLEKPWKADRRTDLYALGVVLCEMLTGRLPPGESEPPRQMAGVDPRLEEIVTRALARQPRRRYQSANEFRAAVEEATGHFHNLPGDMPQGAGRRKWKWLPRFALAAGAIWLVTVTYILLKDHWSVQKSILIPSGALEAIAIDPEGGGLGGRMAADLKLDKTQAQNVNRIVRRYQREFRTLELQHTERSKNAAGHIVVTIQPFPGEMDELMEQMWTDLSQVISAGRVAAARTLRFERLFPHTGKKPVTIEIWQDENGDFHYVENQESSGNNGGGAGLPASSRRGLHSGDKSETNR